MIKDIFISAIKVDESTQSRAGIDQDTVKSYAQDIQDGAKFPPVTIFHDGKDHWLADGFHRVEAYRLLNHNEVQADIQEGGMRDAVLHSVGANATHGLRRTNADKRRAIELLLTDQEWIKWSDREIAKKCGVAPNTVKARREKLSVQIAQIDTPAKSKTVKRKGTTYQQNTKNIGKKKQAEKKAGSSTAKDAPQKSDKPDYLAFQAKTFLKEIDPSDAEGAKHLEEIRDWINEKLGDQSA